eukprot:c36068_g1_i1 orf=1-249(+)
MVLEGHAESSVETSVQRSFYNVIWLSYKAALTGSIIGRRPFYSLSEGECMLCLHQPVFTLTHCMRYPREGVGAFDGVSLLCV